MREVLSKTDKWDVEAVKFLHTTIIYSEDGRTFVATFQERLPWKEPSEPSLLASLQGREFFMDLNWPSFDATLTCSVAVGLDEFIKKPNIVEVATCQPEIIQRRILSEARTCEFIRKSPHCNLVDYKGCHVVDGKIQGLVSARYTENLYDRAERGGDLSKVVSQVFDGLNHLHSLGIVHPRNIMFDRDDNAVLIDFDSARPIGAALCDEDKEGVPIFTKRPRPSVALVENDYYSIERIKKFIIDQAGQT